MTEAGPATYQRLRAMPPDLRKAVRKEVFTLLQQEKRPEFADIAALVNKSLSTATARIEIGYEIVRTLNKQLKGRTTTPTTGRGDSDEATKDQAIANLRAVNLSLTRTNKKLMTARTVTEAVREATKQTVTALPPAAPVFIPGLREREHVQEAVLQLSCWHYGEVVSPEETAGFGAYDIAMAQARAQYLTESVIDLAIDHHRGERIRKLWVVDLGDNVSGDIHDELRVTNERPIIPQVTGVSFLLAQCLRDFSAVFEEVELIGLPGNHPRTQKKPMHKAKAENSFDRMVYETIGLLTSRLDNVKVTIPGAFFHRVLINDWYFLYMHGDNIRSWMNLPHYGMYRADANMTKLHASRELFYRYLGLGHFHVAGTLPNVRGEILLTGSLKGPDEFSLDVLQTGAEPNQLFYGVHKRRGVSFRYPVSVLEADPEQHSRFQFDLPGVTLADAARELGLL